MGNLFSTLYVQVIAIIWGVPLWIHSGIYRNFRVLLLVLLLAAVLLLIQVKGRSKMKKMKKTFVVLPPFSEQGYKWF